jgi:hypothetical protein
MKYQVSKKEEGKCEICGFHAMQIQVMAIFRTRRERYWLYEADQLKQRTMKAEVLSQDHAIINPCHKHLPWCGYCLHL